MKTIYTLNVTGKPLGAIGIIHDFTINVTLDGVDHTKEEIRLKAYDKANHIAGIEITSFTITQGS